MSKNLRKTQQTLKILNFIQRALANYAPLAYFCVFLYFSDVFIKNTIVHLDQQKMLYKMMYIIKKYNMIV